MGLEECECLREDPPAEVLAPLGPEHHAAGALRGLALDHGQLGDELLGLELGIVVVATAERVAQRGVQRGGLDGRVDPGGDLERSGRGGLLRDHRQRVEGGLGQDEPGDPALPQLRRGLGGQVGRRHPHGAVRRVEVLGEHGVPPAPLPVELVLHPGRDPGGHGHVDVGTVDHLVAGHRLVEQVEQLAGATRLAGEGLDGLRGRHDRGSAVGGPAERVDETPDAVEVRRLQVRAAIGADGGGRVDREHHGGPQRLDGLEVGRQADEVGDQPVELLVVGSDEPDVERVGPGTPEAVLEGDPAGTLRPGVDQGDAHAGPAGRGSDHLLVVDVDRREVVAAAFEPGTEERHVERRPVRHPLAVEGRLDARPLGRVVHVEAQEEEALGVDPRCLGDHVEVGSRGLLCGDGRREGEQHAEHRGGDEGLTCPSHPSRLSPSHRWGLTGRRWSGPARPARAAHAGTRAGRRGRARRGCAPAC